MKRLKQLTVLAFVLVIILPLLFFNFQEDAISEIDNRALSKNPVHLEGDFTSNVESYVNDRIGFRNDMILGYTILNDKLFGEMLHPSYTYGKKKCVFGAGLSTNIFYSDYHEAFADMVKKIQDYCQERNIPFLFVFNPAKPAVMEEYIADGINYNRNWVNHFMSALEERNVNYLDNTVVLKTEKEKGVAVFNHKFDANHWNDNGAFYGTNAMLKKMKEKIPSVHVNTKEDVDFSEKKEETLLVSKFPIDEMVPVANVKSSVSSLTEIYEDEIKLNESYRAFGYYTNEERKKDGSPKALVFQGSYMNGYGCKFLQNAFSEYIYIHDYQNILDFEYYYNIFKPDCIIFEVAEYTFSDGYFNFEKMKNMNLQNTYSIAMENVSEINSGELNAISVDEGETLTEVTWENPEVFDQVWLFLGDKEYDFIKTETGYTVTILTEDYNRYREELAIKGLKNDVMYCFE